MTASPLPPSEIDLSGRLILYVGGRHQHVAHLRRIIEEKGGAFVHHDGGVEQSMTKLSNQLERADAVLFPVGCVSHQAQSKVKSLCRRFDKPFRPLRSTGIGAITEALASVARPQ
ncbi:hypothetical protein A6A04_16460 [Paramagnetospirillum marisnigri]|uniref:DUF2325 domain-containing protein n=1 Tax=Paramagnetospirillum marisnigri TaxID=1285242 RepID=A0A178MQB8_9PROT|nr:DUF2325 domain-containing protein [Paramagnetospirillum marisnigri]OAN51249.1 hypothetical protein A6A04_16460 [Paramagnetospirillum marisnigri]